MNQLLVELDGFENSNSVIVMGATNRPDVLDSALLRPGRFDRQVVVDVPDLNGRHDILKIHTKKIKIKPKTVNLLDIAKGTPGMVGADLANLVNEAALLASRKRKTYVVVIVAAVPALSAKATCKAPCEVMSIKLAGRTSEATNVNLYPLKSPSAAPEEISPAVVSQP